MKLKYFVCALWFWSHTAVSPCFRTTLETEWCMVRLFPQRIFTQCVPFTAWASTIKVTQTHAATESTSSSAASGTSRQHNKTQLNRNKYAQSNMPSRRILQLV